MRARATVRLVLACNNRCVFCSQEGLTGASLPPGAQLAVARARTDGVTFVGGEPTLDPELVMHVVEARALGFSRVGIQTNGRRLADPAYTASLAASGLTDVHLSVHGAEAAVHDYHTGVPGSFAGVLAAWGAARASGLTVAVTTVLTRSNFRSLAGLPKLLASRGAAGWVVAVPRVAGRARSAFDRVVPRLGVALPFALHALEAAESLQLPAWIAGAPRCMLGGYARWALDADVGAYARICEGCTARAVCPGVDPAYLARFGGDELDAERAPLDRPTTRHAEVAAMFVGVGELAPGPLATPSEERGRVALPLLEKVRPANGEVTASTPRRSGEALREILPALFDEPDPGKRA